MGKIIEQKITRFDKGMTNDPRTEDFRYAQLIKNFDAHTYPHKLVPFRSSESGDSAASTSQKQAFVIALRTGTTYNLYSLGVQSGNAKAEILMKSLSTGGTNDLSDNGWVTPSNNTSSGGSTSFNLFVYYKKRGRIFGAEGGNNIWSFDPSSSATFSDEQHSLNYTNIAQGLVHSKDDILYIPYDNKIAKNNNNSWTDAALTLPSDVIITSISEYGNYLAVAARPISGYGKSRVYLWDRDSTLATLSESIDWGEGVLQILEEIEGVLIGISYISSAFLSKIIIRQYSGGTPKIIKSFITEASFSSSDLPIFKQKIENYLYFLMTATLGGVKHQGLWKIGRNDSSSPFSLTMDRTPNNDTALTSGTLVGFFIVGDYAFISYVDNGVYSLSKTDDQANYNVSGTYESLKINIGDSHIQKKLIGVTSITEALPAAGQIILKYKKDEETSWTTILTNTTDNSISKSATKKSDGTSLPTFKEIQFQILSTGGAVITGLHYECEIIDNKPY